MQTKFLMPDMQQWRMDAKIKHHNMNTLRFVPQKKAQNKKYTWMYTAQLHAFEYHNQFTTVNSLRKQEWKCSWWLKCLLCVNTQQNAHKNYIPI